MSIFSEAASAIGRRICRDAIWAGECCNWIGPFGDSWDPRDIRQRSFGADLYSGTSGISLFLATLASIDEEPLIRKTAEGAARHAFRHAWDFPPGSQLGVYSGTVGVAWSLIRVGELLGSQAWQEHGVELLHHINLDDSKAGSDIMSGIAGAIPVLLHLSLRFDRPEWREAAVRWGTELQRTATKTPEGWSWKTIDAPAFETQRNLTGFSHGTAGIGWALAQLFHATQEPGFRHASEQAFQYERTFYNPEVENWPDFRDYLRPPGSPVAYGMAWCHGAPGIALSRLRAWRLNGDPLLRQEAEIAVRTTIRSLELQTASHAGFSLCHGCAGNADVLLEAARENDSPELRNLAERIGSMGLETLENQRWPWPCGVPGGGESANLMLGTAGIGYFYLRLADPSIPTVLMIA